MAQKTHADADRQRKRAAVAQPAHSRKLVADANSQAASELHNCCPRALAQLEVQGTLLLVEDWRCWPGVLSAIWPVIVVRWAPVACIRSIRSLHTIHR
jgi:hypothetical protein